ncbi:MAG TPA: DNA gyrase subunit A, partial [Candidatus Desulfofervidus auxilii]|nr:DNA gyrase subunit A [Candidatus Desulfofervidus auxilii]
NLGEVLDALIACIENPNISLDELMKIIPGPDFPTGGIIYGIEGIKEAYSKGKGIIYIRGKVEIEEKKGKTFLVIKEIPFQICKAKLVEKIAELIKEKKLEGISEIRDESDREGIRVVIELKKGEDAQVILNRLYTYTPLEISYGIILLALVNNRPLLLNLKDLLFHFIEHRKEIVIRRTRFELKKAKDRVHILEGLMLTLNHLDEIISLIRKAESPTSAKKDLIERFSLSEIQAQAILDMRLQRLTQLEREKLIKEYKDLIKDIERYESILSSEALVNEIIKDEFKELKETYADARKTEIRQKKEIISVEDLIPDEEVVVTITYRGYIKRIKLDVYKSQKRGGKGIIGTEVKKDDFVQDIFVASTHSYLLIFTAKGIAYALKVHEIPTAGRIATGKPLINLLRLSPQEKIAIILPIKDFENNYFITIVTKKGFIKRTSIKEFAFLSTTTRGIKAATIDSEDELVAGRLTDGKNEIFLLTRQGQCIRFKETNIRLMGRTAKGVKGIDLGYDDVVIGMETLNKNKGYILIITENGYGKRTPVEFFRPQNRGGKGIIAIKPSKKTGNVIGMCHVENSDEILLITNLGKIIRLKSEDISVMGRQAKGVKLINLGKDEKVAGLAKIVKKDVENFY